MRPNGPEYEIIAADSSTSYSWDGLANVFTEEVNSDYHLLSGQRAQTIKSVQIVTNWAIFVPKFKFTTLHPFATDKPSPAAQR